MKTNILAPRRPWFSAAVLWQTAQSPWFILFFASACMHYWQLGYPNQIAFDESLVGHFASYYFTGEYYFDIHPPHMKLIYAALAWLAGMPEGFNFQPFSTNYPTNFYVWIRLFPAFCGTILPLLMVKLALDFKLPRLWAFCLGWLMAFDTALLVESRFVLNDIPLLAFGFGGWCAFSHWWHNGGKRYLLLGTFFISLASCVKWTGLGFSVPVFVALLWAKDIRAAKRFRGLLVMVLMLFTVQVSGYVVHYLLLPKAGPGDAYMSLEMQEALKRQRTEQAESNWSYLPYAVLELNRSMAFHASRVDGHPYSSPMYKWPLGTRGIYVWMNGKTPPNRIYLVPNLAVWWPLAFGTVYFFISMLARFMPAVHDVSKALNLDKQRPRKEGGFERVDYLLAMAYLGNFLPFLLIGRAMFIYHYFPALSVSYLIVGRLLVRERMSTAIAWLWPLAAALGYAWLLPVLYGYAIDEPAFQIIMLLKSWI